MKQVANKRTWTETLQSVATDYADGKFEVYVGRKDERVSEFNKLIVKASKKLPSAKRRGMFIGILMQIDYQRTLYKYARLSKLQMKFLETLAKS